MITLGYSVRKVNIRQRDISLVPRYQNNETPVAILAGNCYNPPEKLCYICCSGAFIQKT